MMPYSFFGAIMFRFLLFLLCMAPLAADGLADLREALGRFTAKTTVKGTLRAQQWTTQGKDAAETKGEASAFAEYGPDGLKLSWGSALLRQLDEEAKARAKGDPKTNQASIALWAMEPMRSYAFFDAAGEISRILETADFRGEGQETFNGRRARALTFSLPQSGAPERMRRYIKEHSSTAKIWIDEEGNPLGSWRRTEIKARAFLVVSFTQMQEVNMTYAPFGDRLVCLRHDETLEGGGGGEYGKSRSLRTFSPRP